MLFFYLFVFIFGLAVGSFLNCVIYRLQFKESFLRGRSYCPFCKHILGWKDLIPVFSFLFLKGKCRYCHKKISIQYPLVEIATGLLFILIFNSQLTGNGFLLFNGDPLSVLPFLSAICFLFFASCLLIIIFVYDLKHYIIPDKIIYPAILVSGVWYLISGIFFNLYSKWEILNTIYAALGAAVFFLAIVLISRGRWMGFGDVKLAFLIGLLLGFPNILVALFLSFLIGAIIGLGLVLTKKKTFKSEIPFGPFLVTGTFIAMFWGEKIIQYYLNLFV